MVRKTTGELEYSFGWHIIARQFRIAAPANFDSSEQIGLGPRKAEQSGRFELRVRTENFGIGREGYGRTAPVGCRTQFLQLANRQTL